MRPTQLLTALFTLLSTCGLAQGLAGAKNLDNALLVNAGYGGFISAGDLGDRFGGGFAIDGGLAYLPRNSSWQFGVRAVYGFGNEVKEDVLAGLRTRDGFVIGNQREPADVQLRQRQVFLGPSVGYTFRIGANQRSGINLRSSVGYFANWIKLQEDPVQAVEPLLDDYRGGYDRLTAGPAWYQFVGYQTLSENRRINFYLGGDFTVASTTHQRLYDIPTAAAPASDRRLDITFGARIGLIVPLYFGEGREIFY